MLKRMRRRVIMAAMLAFFAVISLVAALVNIVNYAVVAGRLDETISYIMNYEESALIGTYQADEPSDGAVIGRNDPEAAVKGEGIDDVPARDGGNTLGANAGEADSGSPARRPFMPLPDVESNYMMRFFVVRFDDGGDVISVSTDYVVSVDESEAEQYGRRALADRAQRGYIKEYRYQKKKIGDITVIVFLNAFRDRQFMKSLLLLTIVVSVASTVLVFVLVVLFAGRAIRPFANNIKRQKQFITDASHELKTPLTSISTSMEVITMEHGDDEWTDNIRAQTERMSKLVSELVTLSRLDEELPLPNKETFSLSTAAWEIAEVYRPQAKACGKNFIVDIQDDVTLYGEKSAVTQMLSVLLDNAIRYSEPEGDIRFSVYKKRGKVRIEVFNTCQLEEPPDTERLFDRFYRPDGARSAETGGTGVGLAIAKAVVENHDGSITASCPSGKTMTIKVIF